MTALSSLRPVRSLLPDLRQYSLLVPATGPRHSRGHGLLAGVLAAVAAGFVDGIMSVDDIPRALAPVVVAQCAAVSVAPGLCLGVFIEALLAAGERVVILAQGWRWIARGPRTWFARDPGATTRLTLGFVAAAGLVAPVFLMSRFAVARMHSGAMMTAAITSSCVVALIVTPLALVLLAAPLRTFFGHAGRFASPGAVVTAVGITALPVVQGLHRAASHWFDEADWSPTRVSLTVPIVMTLALLGLWRGRRDRRPLGLRALAVGLALFSAALGLSASTLGESHVASRAVLARTVLAGPCVRVLQRILDGDGDGASAWFGGGDCDDADPHLHPMARDIPGNGIDENCSGADARPLADQSDGALSDDTGLPTGAAPSFVLVTIDTLRPDHVGAYGYRRPTTPHIDAFARGAARFDQAFSTSPRTLRSLSAIWTGRYPSQLAWGSNFAYPALEASNVTLAELLSDAGYATGAFIASGYFRHMDGFLQGFSTVTDGEDFKDDAYRTAHDAAAWIGAHGSAPFFAWIHLLEPHHPYRDLHAPREFGRGVVDRYDEEVARADDALAAVFDAVSAYEAAHPDRPLVTVLSADHGEGLYSHGRLTHGVDLHTEALRVPLLVRAPGVAPGPRRALASLVDLHATVLNYARVPLRVPIESRSLLPVLRDPNPARVVAGWHERVFAEVMPDQFVPQERKAIIAPPWSLLWDVHHGTWELYDSARDPGQHHNLIDEQPGTAAMLRDDVLAWTTSTWAERRDAIVSAARLAQKPAPSHPQPVRYEALSLLGYDLPSRSVTVGEVFRVTLYYQVHARTRERLSIGLALLPDGVGRPLDASHYPVHGHYQTTEWTPGEWIRDDVELRIDPRTPPGPMRLRWEVRTASGTPVTPVGASDGQIELGEVTLTARSAE